jgi:flagellar motility protein MotE (MotC chaperone)
MIKRNMKFLTPDNGGGTPTPSPANQPGVDPGALPPGGDPPPPAAPPVKQQGKNVILPSHAFTERLEKAKKAGRTAYQAELDKQAQGLGFANNDAMIQHLRDQQASRRSPNGQQNGNRPNGGQQRQALTDPPPPQAPVPPKNKNDRQAMQKYEQEQAKLRRENERIAKERDEQKRLRRRAENQRNAIEAEATLKDIARGAGVQEVSIAIHLFREHCQGMSEADLEKLDEAKFFEGLRATRPYLFGEATVQTSTGTSGAPPAAPRSAGTPLGAPPATVDAMTMDRDTWNRHQQKNGIRSFSSGLG